MKKIYILSLSFFCFLFYAHAQNATMGINYQGVARSQTGVPLPNTKLDIKLHINDSIPSKSKKRVYGEFFNVTTNSMGLYTLVIGTGSPLISVFGKIDWTQGIKNLEVEIQPNGAANYIYVGEFPLQFVPYALFAEHVRHELKPGNGIAITNDTIYNTGSTPQINLTNGGGILITGTSPNYTITAEDSSNTNELQMLSLSNDTLYLSNGNYILMKMYKDNTDSQKLNKNGSNISLSYGGSITLNDDDSTNELQQISKTNKNISIDKNGGTISLNDDDSTNELQALSISGDTLFLSQGNYIYLGGYKDNTDSQNLSLANDTLSISNGNNVSLNKYLDNTDNQTLNKNGNNISLTSGGNVTLNDDDSTNEIQLLNKTNNTISLNKNGGNVLLNDDDSVNEIQQITYSNDTLFLNKNGGYIKLPVLQTSNNYNEVDSLQGALANGLIAYYPFNKNTKDYSGNGHTGALLNVYSDTLSSDQYYSYDRFGREKKCLFNTYINPADSTYGKLIYAMYVKNDSQFYPNNISCSYWLFGTTGSILNATSYSLSQNYIQSTTTGLYLGGAGGVTNSNKWMHIVLTFDKSGKGKQYIDGVLMNLGTNITLSLGSSNNPIKITEGYQVGGADDIALYNRVLSDSEVYLLYRLGGYNGNSSNTLEIKKENVQVLSNNNATLSLSNGGGSVNVNKFPLPSDSSQAVNAKAAIVNYLAFGSTSSNNNIYNINLPITPPTYQAGMMITFMADSANTDSVSINVNGLGIKRLKKLVSNELAANDILMGQMVIVVYDGTNFQMMSTPSNTLKSPADNKTLIYTTDGF